MIKLQSIVTLKYDQKYKGKAESFQFGCYFHKSASKTNSANSMLYPVQILCE